MSLRHIGGRDTKFGSHGFARETAATERYPLLQLYDGSGPPHGTHRTRNGRRRIGLQKVGTCRRVGLPVHGACMMRKVCLLLSLPLSLGLAGGAALLAAHKADQPELDLSKLPPAATATVDFA